MTMTLDERDPLPRECCQWCHRNWSLCRCDEQSLQRWIAISQAMRAKDDTTAQALIGVEHD